MTWSWLLAAEFLWVVAMAIWILLEKRSPQSTLAWILALALLPAVGVPIYLLIGPRRLERQRRRYNQSLADHSDFGLVRPPLLDIPHDVLRQVRLAAGAAEAPLLPVSRFDLLRDSDASLQAMTHAVDAANHHVHLEFYIWEDDEHGRRLREHLVAAAHRGAEVRVLVDAVGSATLQRSFFDRLVEAGGQMTWFNPPRFGVTGLQMLNFRTHRKMLIVDGRVGFTGGRNISARYSSGGSGGKRPWRDTDVRIEGPAVAGLQAAFLENWHYVTGRPPSGEPYFPRTTIDHVAAWVQVVDSGPDRLVYPIHELIVSAISAADERVWIVNPYVVPEEALHTALVTAAHRGVDVRLIVPSVGDSRFVQAAMRSYFDELTACGVRIFEYQPGMHHGKTLVVDDELAVVGTANLDSRSFRLNFEIVVALHGARAAARLAEDFERDLGECREVAPGYDGRIGPLRRLAQAGARLFAPIL